MFVVLEALGALLYLAQKIALSQEKKIAWFFGLLGSFAFTAVVLRKGSYAYAVLEITSGITFVFGLLLWGREAYFRKRIVIGMSIVALVGVALVFLINLGSPNWLLENALVVAFIAGAVLLVLHRPAGWLFYIVGQLILIVYAYQLDTYFILALQVASLPIMIVGYQKFRSSRKSS